MNERKRRARLDDIRRVAETLRESPIEAPDFTSSILDRVDAERPFLAPSVRRRLPWVRIGLGVCVAATTLMVAMAYRVAPRAVRMATMQAAPVSDVVQCVECAAASRLDPSKLIPLRGPMLSVRESDATQFLSAMATVASISENEGRRMVALVPASVAAAKPIAAPSQAVAIDTPAAPDFGRSAGGTMASRFEASVFPRESILSSSAVRTAVFSADVPRARVVPAFLEHDLDGVILPR